MARRERQGAPGQRLDCLAELSLPGRFLPSPLVGEGGHRRPSAAVLFKGRRCFASAMRSPRRMRGLHPRRESLTRLASGDASHPLPQQGERVDSAYSKMFFRYVPQQSPAKKRSRRAMLVVKHGEHDHLCPISRFPRSKDPPMSDASRQAHWENVYTTKTEKEVSWFQENPAPSLELIAATGLSEDAAIIDIGGGASRLVDDLLTRKFHRLTVLDLSGAALAAAKARLGERGAPMCNGSSPTSRNGTLCRPMMCGMTAPLSIS